MSKRWRFLLLALLVVGLDQVSKYGLSGAALNSGVSFGVAAEWSGWGWLLGALWSGGVLTTVWMVRSWPVSAQSWTVVFWSAALSNLLDRWWLGSVRDPLWFPWWGGGGANNLADWMLFFSALALMWYALRNELRNSREFSGNSHPL